ncbi:secondary thiamine-phosphate synthase enzyme YjbQ [Kolteria novifilia]|uniref:secondary thiamine-phosphate synthase enzyme YjbQ n=1 Tax=Kolteria novifilia TaxID=2527975 RepID=UPI003AF39F18
MYTLDIRTQTRTECIDVTEQVQRVIDEAGLRQGAVIAQVPHTSAACTLNESADPEVGRDLVNYLDRLVPKDRELYGHEEENADAHIKTSLVGSSVHLIVERGRLVLGRWQGVFFCEFDGPRDRKMHLQLLRSV